MSSSINNLLLNQLFTYKKNVYTQMILSYEDPGQHSHEFIEFFYVLDGQCIHSLNGAEKNISCGDAFLITPNNVHTFLPFGKNFMHRDIIITTDYFKKICNLYSNNLYDQFLSDKNFKHLTFSNNQLNKLEMLAQQLKTDYNEQDDKLDCMVCTYIINAFLEKNLNIAANNYPAWVSRLLSLLSAPENFKTDQQYIISGAFSYSQEYVCRTFKKITGVTITNYFNEQKMKYAYSLLLSSSYSIEQICERINFNSVSYFYRLFKKHFGITPKEVLSNNENKLDQSGQ